MSRRWVVKHPCLVGGMSTPIRRPPIPLSPRCGVRWDLVGHRCHLVAAGSPAALGLLPLLPSLARPGRRLVIRRQGAPRWPPLLLNPRHDALGLLPLLPSLAQLAMLMLSRRHGVLGDLPLS